jgi:hypothetical protein
MAEWLPPHVIEASDDPDVRLAFERQTVSVPISVIVPLKSLREGVRESKKYAQIVNSIKAIGLIEAPVIIADTQNSGQYFLLDGHLRIEALKELGIETVDCLVATDDETYTYNKRVNRLPPLQEHRMIARAVERGVAPTVIAKALGLDVASIQRKFRLLDGICPEAAEILKDTICPMNAFDVLRRMSPTRQIEAADLMVGQNNFSLMFAKALLAATPDDQLVKQPKKNKKADANGPTAQQIARMERELAALQTQVKSVEDSYGIDNLHLTVARGYIAKLLSNALIVRWLSQHHQEYLSEFQRIAEMESIAPASASLPIQD